MNIMAQSGSDKCDGSKTTSNEQEEKSLDIGKQQKTNMVKPLNENEKVLDLEHQISELIRNGRSGCHASFRYSHQGSKVRTKLVTWNPKHRSTFLVHETEARSRTEALNEMLMYVKDKIRDQEKP